MIEQWMEDQWTGGAPVKTPEVLSEVKEPDTEDKNDWMALLLVLAVFAAIYMVAYIVGSYR